MQVGPVHEAIKPISWLIGKWKSISANGSYPTIKSFEYCEELEFISVGQPLLNYSSKTWNAMKLNPMKHESGFLRIKPGTNELSFIVAHNFGLASIEEGNVNENEIKLKSVQISRSKFAKDPAVTAIERVISFKDETLEIVLLMATENTPLTQHLKIIYKKET